MRSALRFHHPHFLEFDGIDPDRFDLIVPTTLKDARYFNPTLALPNHLNRFMQQIGDKGH